MAHRSKERLPCFSPFKPFICCWCVNHSKHALHTFNVRANAFLLSFSLITSFSVMLRTEFMCLFLRIAVDLTISSVRLNSNDINISIIIEIMWIDKTKAATAATADSQSFFYTIIWICLYIAQKPIKRNRKIVADVIYRVLAMQSSEWAQNPDQQYKNVSFFYSLMSTFFILLYSLTCTVEILLSRCFSYLDNRFESLAVTLFHFSIKQSNNTKCTANISPLIYNLSHLSRNCRWISQKTIQFYLILYAVMSIIKV